MSNQPGPWGQPNQGQPNQGQPNQGQPGGWSAQGQPASGWGQQGGQPQGGQHQGGQPAYGGYQPQGAYQPQSQPQGSYQGGGAPYQPPPGGGGGKKSPALIIGIVVVAVVLIAAVGGIFMAVNRGAQDPVSTVTPGQQSDPPSADPSSEPSADPSTDPSDPATETPTSDPSASEPPTGGGKTYSLDNGIKLTAAEGWASTTTKAGFVVLQSSDGEVFEGQSVQLKGSTDPKQVVDTWHQQLAEKMSDVKNDETTSVDLGSTKLNAASGVMVGTIATSQGSLNVITESVVSVRKSDGVTVIATIRYFKDSDLESLKTAYKTMAGSMLNSQAKG